MITTGTFVISMGTGIFLHGIFNGCLLSEIIGFIMSLVGVAISMIGEYK